MQEHLAVFLTLLGVMILGFVIMIFYLVSKIGTPLVQKMAISGLSMAEFVGLAPPLA